MSQEFQKPCFVRFRDNLVTGALLFKQWLKKTKSIVTIVIRIKCKESKITKFLNIYKHKKSIKINDW